MSFKNNKQSQVALVEVITLFLLSIDLLCQAEPCLSRPGHHNPVYEALTFQPDPLYFEGCGKAKLFDSLVNSPLRLKGSLSVKDGQTPYYVRIGFRGGSIFCSGLLITDQHVLTAGHCADYTRNIEVVFADDLAIPTHTICKSPKYHLWEADKQTKVIGAYYDLALVKLDRPVEFSNLIQPICLPKEPIPSGLQLWSSGKETDKSVDREKIGVVPSLQVECTGKNIHESVLCAKPNDADRMQSACPGDSGSPLAGVVDGKWTVFGITSYGRFEDCRCHNNSVVYYVDVYNMMDELKKLFAKCG